MSTEDKINISNTQSIINQSYHYPEIAVRLSKTISNNCRSRSERPDMQISQNIREHQLILARPHDFLPGFFGTSNNYENIAMPINKVKIQNDNYISHRILKRFMSPNDKNTRRKIIVDSKKRTIFTETQQENLIRSLSPCENSLEQRLTATVPFRIHTRTRSVQSVRAATAKSITRTDLTPEEFNIPAPESAKKAMRVKTASAERIKLNRNISLLTFENTTNPNKQNPINKEQILKRILKPKNEDIMHLRGKYKKWYANKAWGMGSGYYKHNFAHNINQAIALSKGNIITVSTLFNDKTQNENNFLRAKTAVAQAKFGSLFNL